MSHLPAGRAVTRLAWLAAPCRRSILGIHAREDKQSAYGGVTDVRPRQVSLPRLKGEISLLCRAFLTYLAKTKLDARYESFRLFLELPKAVKTRKLVTGRIVTIEDVQNVFAFLKVRYAGHSDRANHALRITI